ncbi:MAG TPA: radical SAM protein [Stellaceae bacterium]
MASQRFALILIKPSHYDDDGYVIQWWRSVVPSNTLAALHGLALDCQQRRVLGDGVEIDMYAFDETNTRIVPERIARLVGNAGLVCLVGVQSNQYPRAMDIARPLRRMGVSVAIGGFHVSGSLTMLPGIRPELQEAIDLGISLFAGEAEGRLDNVLRDAYRGELKPIYNYMDDLPNLAGVPTPFLPRQKINRYVDNDAAFDAGRGCPFQCSFCTIINVQGRISRRRTADDVEAIVRANAAQGVANFFISDDNFARNKDWEEIFDRLIYLRDVEKLNIWFLIQVDTLCHRIPNFIEKAGRAGVEKVFIGLESISPEALAGAKKRQNRITEYREMMLAWKKAGAHLYAGYIIGFPTDTPESLMRDIEIVKRELPIDMLEFFFLTPLPGSEDHQKLFKSGAPLESDLNKYDLEHVCTTNPTMSRETWEKVYRDAWRSYYSSEHIVRVMKRAFALNVGTLRILYLMLAFRTSIELEKVHPLQSGYFRLKYRRDRRPGMPLESPLVFYPKYAFGQIYKHLRLLGWIIYFGSIRFKLARDPHRRDYTDEAMTPIRDDEFDSRDMYKTGAGTAAAIEKHRKENRARAKLTASG